MKKMFFRSLAVVAIAAVACYNVYQSNSVMNRLSDLALANVEALAEDNETVKYQDCTRALTTVNCYKPNGMWAALSITSVETYQVEVGSILECRHDRVTTCPSVTYAR